MEERQDRMLGKCILTGILWLGLHLFVAVQNAGDSLYVTFDRWTYVWMAVYTVVLLLLDGLLYFLNSRSAAKSWLKYWTFCAIASLCLLLCSRFHVEVGLWALLPLAATPLLHFDPLWRRLFPNGSDWGTVCTMLFCGAHMLYFIWMRCRIGEKSGKRP